MKIISIVGLPRSGKTSTIVALIEAIRRRGKTVGTCKTIHTPTFTKDHSICSTMRYRRAGSEPVCVRAKGETAVLYPEALPLSKVLESCKGCDYALLEGDYFAPVPRIICAHQEEDALLRMNTRTLAFAGCISERADPDLPLPCFNALCDAEGLLDYIDARIPDIMPCSLLDALLPPVSGVTDDGFSSCDSGSREQTPEADALQILLNGKEVRLTDEQRATLFSWIKEATDVR